MLGFLAAALVAATPSPANAPASRARMGEAGFKAPAGNVGWNASEGATFATFEAKPPSAGRHLQSECWPVSKSGRRPASVPAQRDTTDVTKGAATMPGMVRANGR